MMGAPIFLSLFAGIGGFEVGLEAAGWRCVGQVEIDPFCQRVLAVRFPGVPRWGDVRSVGQIPPSDERAGRGAMGVGRDGSNPDGLRGAFGGPFPRVDLLVGGFPCQGASVAGKRLGLRDDRTALFWEIIRIQKIVQAPWGLFENVPGLRSVALGRDFETVLAALRECWPVVGWRTLDSRYGGGCALHGRSGVPQRRQRVFFVCGPTEDGVASVLFEPEGSSRHLTAGREAGADVAHALALGTGSAGYRYDPNGEDYVVTALRHLGSGGPDDNEAQGGHLITPTLTAEGADASIVRTRFRDHAKGGPVGMNIQAEQAYELRSTRTQGVATSLAVRRLTPLECERLQGFPDGWTCLCQPLETYAADPDAAAIRCRCPDGPRYRALGNAVTVSVVAWLARRMKEAMG